MNDSPWSPEHSEQFRRAKLFTRIMARRDLVYLTDIAKEPAMGAYGFDALVDAAMRGELGDYVYCLPRDVPTYRPYWTRRSPLGVAQMRHSMPNDIPGLCVPRAIAARWFQARSMPVPPWLAPKSVEQTAQVAPSIPQAIKPKNRGGRPRTYDWDAFAAEVVRRAQHPDGLPDRPALMRGMLEWCSQQWGDTTPSESMVRDRLSKLYPE
ncbi:MAG TPA: hypothetical protein VMB73_25475 [Acetobacteraceae bacterium]|nr:hypothetical protein [Acetobacteraceae bacterium]